MRLRNFCLFKLPIDNTYENVFDGWATKEMGGSNSIAFSYYIDYLTNLYTTYINPNQLNRSVKITNGVSTITLPVRYDFAKDFNYCILETTYTSAESQYTAFFITSVTSENDSDDNPSCTLTIEYDVWTNNYPRLVLDDYNRNAYITEGHIHRFEETVSSGGTLTYKTVDAITPRGDCPYTDKINNFTPSLLWAVYEWNTDYVRVTPHSSTGIQTFDLGNNPSYGTFVYTFAPWRWVKPNGEQSANFTVKDRGGNVLFSSSSDEIVKTQGSSGSAAPHLYNVYLTYYPPFFDRIEYSIGEDKTVIISTDETVFSYILLQVPNSLGTGTDEVFGGGGTGFVCLGYSQLKNALSSLADYGNKEVVSVSDVLSNEAVTEIPYVNYPYDYRYYDFQGKRVNVVNGRTFPKHKLTATPSVWGTNFEYEVYEGDNLISRQIIPVQQIGAVPFSVDRLEQYQRDNAFTIGARLISGSFGVELPSEKVMEKETSNTHKYYMGRKIGYKTVDLNKETISTVTKPTAIGIVSGFARNALTIGSELLSLANQPDEAKNSSSFSQLMFYTMDRPIIHDVTYKKTELFYSDYQLTLSNGYILSRYDDVISNSRTLFDYVKCGDFNAVTVYADFERTKLNLIFTNGVRKWHIQNFTNSFYSTEQQNKIKSLDTRVVNPEPFLI